MTRHRILAVIGALALAGCAVQCDPVNPPQPGPVGGSAGQAPVVHGGRAGASQGGQGGWEPFDTGGRASQYAQCVAEQSADPVVQNVATQSGVSLSSLVAEMCRDSVLQGGYR